MTAKSLTEQLQEAIRDIDAKAMGNIFITSGDGLIDNVVYGEIITTVKSFKKKLEAVIDEMGLIWGGTIKAPSMNVISTRASENPVKDIIHEAKTLFVGEMPIECLIENAVMKRVNPDTTNNLSDCVAVLGFIAPIILDRNLKIIDGNLRLSIARQNEFSVVPVIVVDVDEIEANFLRAVINRSSEFQRWNYGELDAFIDSVPNLQPLLEPLGLFGKKYLPASFFSSTMVDYRVDEFADQMSAYVQDAGLLEWAEAQRKRRDDAKAVSEARKEAIRKSKGIGMVSLFDLEPKEEDFAEVHDINEVLEDTRLALRKTAGIVTEEYDKVRKEEIERTGGKWQNSRRTSKQKALDNKALHDAKNAEDNFDDELGGDVDLENEE